MPTSTRPVTILTGFLGSGKTTILNHLLHRPELEDTAVLMNERGEIPIDHWLVSDVREDLVVLSSGCVCCSVREDLVSAMRDLIAKAWRKEIPRFRRVLIETTGLANPTPIAGTIVRNGLLREHYHLAAVITTFDAQLGPESAASQPEVKDQLALADRVLLTKSDLVSPDQLARAEQLARHYSPGTPITRTQRGQIAPETVLAPALSGASLESALDTWLGDDSPYHDGHAHEAGHHGGHAREAEHHHAHDGAATCSVTLDAPVPFGPFAIWMSLVTQGFGPRLLRIKAVLQTVEDELPVVAQAVQHVVYPTYSLPAWPEARRSSRIVLITRDCSVAERQGLAESLRSVCSA